MHSPETTHRDRSLISTGITDPGGLTREGREELPLRPYFGGSRWSSTPVRDSDEQKVHHKVCFITVVMLGTGENRSNDRATGGARKSSNEDISHNSCLVEWSGLPDYSFF